jgi:hypothetical protein
MSDYWGRFNQSEKRDELEHDKPDSYLSRAKAAIELEAAGRFKLQQEMRLTGSATDPIPRQPDNSPYASNPVPPGDDDKLGYSIEDVEPVILPTPAAPEVDPSSVEREEPPSPAPIDEGGSAYQPQPNQRDAEPAVAVGGSEGKASAQPSRFKRRY